MSEQRFVLILDDAARFPTAAPFAPDYTVVRMASEADALAFLNKHPDTAIVIINLEASIERSIALLQAIRSRESAGQHIVVGLGLDRGDLPHIVQACEAGADELIIRPMLPSVVQIQLGKLIRLHNVCTASTERRRALQLHTMIDSVGTGVGLFSFVNEKVNALYINAAFAAGVELLLGEACSCDCDLLAQLPQPESDAILNAIHRNLRSGVPIDIPLQMQHEQRLVALRLRALPIHYEGHESPVFLANLTDVTPQRLAEDALQESNLKLNSLMNAVPGGIAVYEVAAGVPRLVYYNSVLRNMCGYTAEEYDRIMELDFHQLLDPRDHALIDRIIAKYEKQPQAIDESLRIITKEGFIRWMRMSVSPIGQGKLCCAVFIDVSREKENELRTEQMLSELYFRTEHDALTGITNREAFYQRTAELLRRARDTSFVILVMDIDRFKVINDLFGKEVGDRVLIAIAKGLERTLRNIGTCARMEADHFVACFPLKYLDMDRIVRLMDHALKRQNIDYHISMSFGIYQVRNINVPVHHMCDRAMMALKTVKGNAVRRYAVYDDHLRQSLLDENAILEDMEEALAERQFEIYLQPIFNAGNQHPVSAEVLVRWRHPVKGLLSPSTFVPLFERNGFIAKLDHYVWERACELLAVWKTQDYSLPLSVNISRVDLYNPNLCALLLELLQKHGLSPAQLRLEITESAYAEDLAVSIDRLRSAGFAILMDDFGSGYSSLNVLMDMPVDALKLDMRFLAKLNTNPRAASILTSVVRMAKWLHMPVIAEGVETWDQLSFLRSIGCDHVQGYLFARPMTTAEYAAQYIAGGDVPMDPDLPILRGTVDLSCLWDGSPQADALFNGMIGGMGIYELVGETLEVRRVNDGYYELFGCTPQQVFEGAQEALLTIHPDDRPRLLAVCRNAAASGRVERLTCRHIHVRDGNPTWLEARLRHLGKAGANDVFCFTFTDVTEQKEFEQSRALSTYAMVLRSVYNGLYEMNLTRRTMRSVYTMGCLPSAQPEEQPLATLQTMLSRMLAAPDTELESLIFTDGYLRQLMREAAGGYYLTERQVNLGPHRDHWASFTFIRLPQSDTADEAYLLCIADVNARKHADDLVKENLWLQRKQQEFSRYQTMMEHLGTALVELDVQTNEISISSGFKRYAISGFDFQGLTSYKDLEPYFYLPDLSVFRMFVYNLLDHGSAAVTLRMLDQDGRPMWCRILTTLIADDGGRVQRVVSAINEIDEQMKVREGYLDEQTRFQAFSDNFMVGLGVFEIHGTTQRILYLSGGYRQMVGYGEDEPLYDATHSFVGVHPEDLPRFRESSQALLDTQQPYTIEYRVFHKDGRVLWMRSHNVLFSSSATGPARIYSVIQDITELKRLQAQALQKLEGLPLAAGVYALESAQPSILLENRLMAAWKPPAADAQTPAIGMDQVLRLRDCALAGQCALDVPITLRASDGLPTQMRMLVNVTRGDVGLQAFCTLIPATQMD